MEKRSLFDALVKLSRKDAAPKPDESHDRASSAGISVRCGRVLEMPRIVERWRGEYRSRQGLRRRSAGPQSAVAEEHSLPLERLYWIGLFE